MKSRSLSLVSMTVLAVFFAIQVYAQNEVACKCDENEIYEQALTAYKAGDYDDALMLLRPAADKGYVKSQNLLADCYYHGRGVNKDLELSALWYRRSAEQGYAPAQYNLGCLYLMGEGVPEDVSEALYWSEKASAQNYVPASYIVGYIYDSKFQDYVSAAKYYRSAADGGNTDAMNNLGLLYESGYGVPKDINKSLALYRKAAESGNCFACYNLGNCYRLGKGVSTDYYAAVDWLKKAIDNGYRQDSQDLSFLIGEMLYHLNDAECYTWLEKSVESGNLLSRIGLGACMVKGLGTDKDVNHAVKIFNDAIDSIERDTTADSDLLTSYCGLGSLHLCNLYYNGLCTAPSRKEMVRLFWTAQYGIETLGHHYWFLSQAEYKKMFDDLSKSAFFDATGGMQPDVNVTPVTGSGRVGVPDILWPTDDIEYVTIHDGEEVSIGGVNFALDGGQLLFAQYGHTNYLCCAGFYSKLTEILADDSFDPVLWISNDDPRLTVEDNKGYLFRFGGEDEYHTFCRIHIDRVNKKNNAIEVSYQLSRVL